MHPLDDLNCLYWLIKIGDLKFGEFKGTDRFGNKYFEVKSSNNLTVNSSFVKDRYCFRHYARTSWIIYKNLDLPYGQHRWVEYSNIHDYDASMIPPEWVELSLLFDLLIIFSLYDMGTSFPFLCKLTSTEHPPLMWFTSNYSFVLYLDTDDYCNPWLFQMARMDASCLWRNAWWGYREARDDSGHQQFQCDLWDARRPSKCSTEWG